MSATGLPVFDETVQKTNTWLKEIAQALGSDRHRAYQALRAVLHRLRDRLTVAAHLGDQRPMLVRGHLLRGVAPGRKAGENSLARRLPCPYRNTPVARTDRARARRTCGVPGSGRTCHFG